MGYRSAALAGMLVLLPAPGAAEDGVTPTTIVLGCSTSFSGPRGGSGEQATRFGVDLYFKVVNESGGIHGRRVTTIYYDDADRPEEARANTRRLVEQDRVFAVIAPQGTPSVLATLPDLERSHVPLLFPLQGAPVTRGKKYVFSGMVLYDRQSRMTIDYLVGRRKYRKFAVLYQDDDYGKTFVKALGTDLARHRLKLVGAEPVPRGVTEVGAQVTRLKALTPQVTFLVLTPAPAIQALKDRQKLGWTSTVMVAAGPLSDDRYLAAAAEASDGVEGLSLWPDPLASDRPGVKRYREQMQKYFPKNEPNRYSLAGYFAAMLFTEAATRAGRELTRDGLVAALETLKAFDSGILPPLTITADHETQKRGFWARMERGRFRPVTDWLPSG